MSRVFFFDLLDDMSPKDISNYASNRLVHKHFVKNVFLTLNLTVLVVLALPNYLNCWTTTGTAGHWPLKYWIYRECRISSTHILDRLGVLDTIK